MTVDSNGVYIPPTIEEINNDLQEQLIAAGVDLNVFNNSNYIQTTNPIVTKIYNLATNIASFPDQIQKIFQLQNIQIARAGIYTADAILTLLLEDPDIEKADVRNFDPGKVTIYVWSGIADLSTKDYTELTNKIVPITSVFGQYTDEGSAPSAMAFRPNSLQQTTVYYNIANEIEIDTSDPSNTLTINYETYNTVSEAEEATKINNKLIEIFNNYKIGQQFNKSLIECSILSLDSNYKTVTATFTGVDIGTQDIYIYVDSNIILDN